MREGSTTGRPVAMVKGLISSLAGTMSQSNVAMPTADITPTMESTSSDVVTDEVASTERNGINNDVNEKPTVLSVAANQLSQETLATR